MREVTTHIMDYIDAATRGILSPHVLPAKDFGEMLSHIKETLLSTMHLPISSLHSISTDTYAPTS